MSGACRRARCGQTRTNLGDPQGGSNPHPRVGRIPFSRGNSSSPPYFNLTTWLLFMLQAVSVPLGGGGGGGDRIKMQEAASAVLCAVLRVRQDRPSGVSKQKSVYQDLAVHTSDLMYQCCPHFRSNVSMLSSFAVSLKVDATVLSALLEPWRLQHAQCKAQLGRSISGPAAATSGKASQADPGRKDSCDFLICLPVPG